MQLQNRCWHVEPVSRLSGDSAPLCERSGIASVIRDGETTADFDYYCKRIKASTPASLAVCSPARKRRMLDGVLQRMLYVQVAERREIQCQSASSTW